MKHSFPLFQKFIFLYLAFFAFSYTLAAQVRSIDSLYPYDNKIQGRGYDIFLGNDSMYYIVGLGYGYTSQPFGTIFTFQIASNGTLLNKTSFFDTAILAAVSIGRAGAARQLTGSDTHGYLVPTTSSYINPDSPRGPYSVDAGLMLLDNKGDTVFSKIYPHPDSSQIDDARACDSLPDGGFIIAGTRFDTGSSNKVYGMVMRTDNAGNLLWTKTYKSDLGYENYLTSVQYIGDGHILLGGNYVFLYYPGGYLVTTDLIPWFLLIDTTGKVITSITTDFVHSHDHAGGANIFKDRNGGFFYFGNFDYAKDRQNYDDDPLSSVPYIAHLNDSFVQDWITSLCDSVTFYNICGGKQLKNGSYLMYGSAGQNTPPFYVAWAAKISKSGALLWHHTFPGFHGIYSFCEVSDVVEHKDGSLTFVGDAEDSLATTPAIYSATWLLGVDSNGIVDGPSTLVPQTYSPASKIQVYPNPSSGIFTVSVAMSGTVMIYGLSGAVMSRKHITAGKTTIRLPDDLAAGTYLFQFIDNEGRISDTKSLSIVR